MGIEYNQRGKKLFKDLIHIILNDKKLLFFPCVSNIILLAITYAITSPIIDYETLQFKAHKLNVYSLLIAYAALFFFLYIRNLVKGLSVCGLILQIERKTTCGLSSLNTDLFKQLYTLCWRIICAMTYISFFGVYYRVADLFLSNKSTILCTAFDKSSSARVMHVY